MDDSVNHTDDTVEGIDQKSLTANDYIEAFFANRDWQIFPFQRKAWAAYQKGQSGLVHSPTGSGKTLSAWLGPVRKSLTRQLARKNPARPKHAQKATVIWITPLRALAADTLESLRGSIEGLPLQWTVGLRTADTKSSERTKQNKRLPTALVTTPESLSLLLSYKAAHEQLSQLECVVIDEWHELIGNKRGVQLELCLATLRALNPKLQTWGLSATMGNIDQAVEVLLGSKERAQQAAVVKGAMTKQISIESLLPSNIERFPWAGHLGTKLVDGVIQQIGQARSTLVFTNTRSQAELWYEALLQAKPEWLLDIALHHGSLSKEVRNKVEDGLRDGTFRVVVCTSSLDLGVDFTPVDQVMQIGSPKGVARLLQRAGRSGHQPGAVSRVICVPTHAFELMEIAAARYAYEEGYMESRRPLTLSLDVLVQHMVTLALGSGFDADELLAIVQQSYAFQAITEAQWQWCLDFITRGGQALQAYDQFQRVVQCEDGIYRIAGPKIARWHRMMIGTITSDSSISVKWQSGGRLGSIEESFIAKLKPGDVFLFSGRALELKRIRDMTAYVTQARQKKRIIPKWQGSRSPLSSTLAFRMAKLFGEFEQDHSPEVRTVKPILRLQARWSKVPDQHQVLFESIKTREGQHWFIYSFAGRLVHEGLGALFAYRLSQHRPITISATGNDYGIELLSRDLEPYPDDEDIERMITQDNLLDDMLNSINQSEMAKRQFRDIARIAGLVFTGYPGANKTARQLQASSGLIYDVLTQYDEDNLLLKQSMQEVLEQQIEYTRLHEALYAFQEKTILVTHPKRLTPMAFPLWAERIRTQVISSEAWKDRVAKMLNTLENAADK